MDDKVRALHEKLSNVYNTLWVAYKEYLKDYSVRHINAAAYALEEKYKDDKTVLQFIWYQKASWSGIGGQVKEWS